MEVALVSLFPLGEQMCRAPLSLQARHPILVTPGVQTVCV